MSFEALRLAVEAARCAPWPDDEEFGIPFVEMCDDLELDIEWVAYRSEGAGVIFGVRKATPVGIVAEALIDPERGAG